MIEMKRIVDFEEMVTVNNIEKERLFRFCRCKRTTRSKKSIRNCKLQTP